MSLHAPGSRGTTGSTSGLNGSDPNVKVRFNVNRRFGKPRAAQAGTGTSLGVRRDRASRTPQADEVQARSQTAVPKGPALGRFWRISASCATMQEDSEKRRVLHRTRLL